ncbi:MAG: sialate O-acetylesterase, partial [Planctomycetota bacterium]|nr:sialate O-acetylesterase [Planctomycetota bacterium]
MKKHAPIVAALVAISLLTTGTVKAAKPKAVQVFILAGQSNMVGHANFITIPTLFTAKEPEVRALSKLAFKNGMTVTRAMVDDQIATMIKRNDLNQKIRKKEITGKDEIAAARAKIKTLTAEFNAKSKKIKQAFAVSKGVYITSIADRNRRSGPLTVGFGGSPDKIGPEFGFGLSLARKIDAPILLIKTSWGGKSLNYNFRPPSAGPYVLSKKEQEGDKVEEIKKNVGLNYRMMNEAVHAVLKDVGKHHPDYNADAGFEMAGFVWFQGFNDQFSPAFRDNYKDNMIAFIKDVRKEYKTPKMPFVIGVLGTNRTAEDVAKNAVSLAQRAAAKAPEFQGNVASVESYEVYSHDAYEVYKKGWAQH